MIFKGVCTALVTPFNKNKTVDYVGLKNLIDHQIKNNISAILILGTTGESSTISYSEREEIIKFTKKQLPKECKLIVGTGTNNLYTTIKYTKQAQSLGADAVLIVTPYYNKCTQNGIVKYYKKISKNTNIPYIVYNVPTRTGFNIRPATYKKLIKLNNMCGIKEANADITHVLEVLYLLKDKTAIYSGNDNLNYIFLCCGAKGTISVTSNIFPDLVQKSFNCVKSGKELMFKLHNLNNVLFIEPNPIPVKYALSKLGIIKPYVRYPLTIAELKTRKKIDKQLTYLGEQ